MNIYVSINVIPLILIQLATVRNNGVIRIKCYE